MNAVRPSVNLISRCEQIANCPHWMRSPILRRLNVLSVGHVPGHVDDEFPRQCPREFVQHGNCTGIQAPGGKTVRSSQRNGNGRRSMPQIQTTSASLPLSTTLTYLKSTAALSIERRVKYDLIKRFSVR
jgi:hypothetical protein